jgi:hypothetical protein
MGKERNQNVSDSEILDKRALDVLDLQIVSSVAAIERIGLGAAPSC